MRALRRIAVSAVIAVGLVAGTAGSPASADTGSEELEFATMINQVRVAHGLQPLEFRGALFDMARAWSGNMLSVKGISHNPLLSVQGPAGWLRLGENVGMGYSVQSLHDAFVASPSHYKNIVDPQFDSVGVGVVHAADGEIFVTVDFETTGTPAAAPAPVKTAARKSTRVCTRNSRGKRVCRRR
ncbi:MAG TPA: CAP domain-containing protein [Acidimicrobiales bacterium]|nr:CAP domain-containing protein [Acidimicrobiales bacterium]